MREPQVARPRPLLVALAALLAVPLLLRALWPLVLSAAFLAEFLSAGRVPVLSRIAPAAAVSPLPVPGVAADLYRGPGCPPPGAPAWPGRACSLVLVHGLEPEGKDDPRLQQAARLLARAGFAVAVPTVPGLARLRLDLAMTDTVVATVAAMPPPVTLVGVSVGAGPALLAAADPRVRDRVGLVLSLGGYASALELARFYLTRRPRLAQLFVAANADLMDASAWRALATGDVAGLSPALRARFAALSPERAVASLRARLLIVHGRDDPLVPFAQSLRLAAAARALHPEVAIVGGIRHVEGSGQDRLGDLLRLWVLTYHLMIAGG